jgi:hypothetical protein
MRRRQPLMGPDVAMMAPPTPMQFAAPPPMPPMGDHDATGAQAISGLAGLSQALMNRPTGPGGGGPVDAPMRRKIPFMDAANAAYA